MNKGHRSEPFQKVLRWPFNSSVVLLSSMIDLVLLNLSLSVLNQELVSFTEEFCKLQTFFRITLHNSVWEKNREYCT